MHCIVIKKKWVGNLNLTLLQSYTLLAQHFRSEKISFFELQLSTKDDATADFKLQWNSRGSKVNPAAAVKISREDTSRRRFSVCCFYMIRSLTCSKCHAWYNTFCNLYCTCSAQPKRSFSLGRDIVEQEAAKKNWIYRWHRELRLHRSPPTPCGQECHFCFDLLFCLEFRFHHDRHLRGQEYHRCRRQNQWSQEFLKKGPTIEELNSK